MCTAPVVPVTPIYSFDMYVIIWLSYQVDLTLKSLCCLIKTIRGWDQLLRLPLLPTNLYLHFNYVVFVVEHMLCSHSHDPSFVGYKYLQIL
jgi:hypothetical protein